MMRFCQLAFGELLRRIVDHKGGRLRGTGVGKSAEEDMVDGLERLGRTHERNFVNAQRRWRAAHGNEPVLRIPGCGVEIDRTKHWAIYLRTSP